MPAPEPTRKRPLAEIEQRTSKKGKLSNTSTGASLADVSHAQTSPEADKTVESEAKTRETLVDFTQHPSASNASRLTNAIDSTRSTSSLSEPESCTPPPALVDKYDVCFGLVCLDPALNECELKFTSYALKLRRPALQPYHLSADP